MSLREELKILGGLLLREERDQIHRLRDSINRKVFCEAFPKIQLLIRNINQNFLQRGWPPLRVHASYFSQDGPDALFEISWLRTDLIAALSPEVSRTTSSHGPGFRLYLGQRSSHGMAMHSRHSRESRDIFIKNVLHEASSKWLEHGLQDCLENTRDVSISARWGEERLEIENIAELRELATMTRRNKALRMMRYSYFSIHSRLRRYEFRDEFNPANQIVDFFARTAPFFWAHHMMLEPRGARSMKQAIYKMSRERLRKEVLKLESRCQHQDCPLDGGDRRMLKVAHLTPQVHLLTNVIALCPLCYDQQYPATSLIRIEREVVSERSEFKEYLATIETRDGSKVWRLASHLDHPLSNPILS